MDRASHVALGAPQQHSVASRTTSAPYSCLCSSACLLVCLPSVSSYCVPNIKVCMGLPRQVGQVRLLMETAASLAAAAAPAAVLPIIAGDFNACPGSPLYRFASRGCLDLSTVDKRSMTGHACNSGYRDFLRKGSHRRRARRATVGSPPAGEADGEAGVQAELLLLQQRPPSGDAAAPAAGSAAAAAKGAPRSRGPSFDGKRGWASTAAASSAVAVDAAPSERCATATPPEAASPPPQAESGGAEGSAPQRDGLLDRLASSLRSLLHGAGPEGGGCDAALGSSGSGGGGRVPGRKGRWSERELLRAVGPTAAGVAGAVAAADGAGDAGPHAPPLIACHPLQLQSTYAAVCGCEPEYTSSHSQFMETCDYIWLPADSGRQPAADAVAPASGGGTAAAAPLGGWTVKPCAVLLPPRAPLLQHGLPAMQLPSDHVALVADFSLVQRS